MKTLSLSRVAEILKSAGVLRDLPQISADFPLSKVTSDSRQVLDGSIFVAVSGEKSDGHAFLTSASRSGAALLLGEQHLAGFSVPYIQVSSSRKALALLAAEFAGNPTQSMKILGVTGTSGKTTTTYLLESILKEAGEKVGVIGTVNFRFQGEVIPSTHTTPGPVELQGLLQEMRQRGCTAVVMEVSSHALKQFRTAGICFDAMVFTNLSPEHLDYHPTMEDYFESKLLLFTEYVEESIRHGKSPVLVVPLEDSWGERLYTEVSHRAFVDQGTAKLVTVSASSSDPRKAQWIGGNLRISLGGIQGSLSDQLEISSPMTGKFNVSNILGAVGAMAGLGYESSVIARGLQMLSGVPGRMEKVLGEAADLPHVWVDYAHKPDALEKVLLTLRSLRDEVSPKGKLICVFGCGGDRDKLKRPKMGEISVRLSDSVIVTSDNPRTESPESILQEILQGIPPHLSAKAELVLDRRMAIEKAIQSAGSEDLVLIAGKGHEDYQILRDPADPTQTIKVHFDDREEAKRAFNLRS